MNEQTPWYLTKKAVNAYVVTAVVFVFGFVLMSTLGSTNNHYIALDQNVSTSTSNISKEEQRRVDLFNNLVDAVQSAKKFEKETQTEIAKARTQGNKGNIEQAMVTIQAVAEAYPEIKSTDLYKQAMLEFSITENRLAQYREQYNGDVKEFNSYVQSFPANIFLSIVGKDKTQKQYLDYKVDNSKARNLFKET